MPVRWRVDRDVFGSGFGVGVAADAERDGEAVGAGVVADFDVGHVERVEDELDFAAAEHRVDLVDVVVQGNGRGLGHGPVR